VEGTVSAVRDPSLSELLPRRASQKPLQCGPLQPSDSDAPGSTRKLTAPHRRDILPPKLRLS